MTDIRKLDRWADLLLDTGKRNNMINFRDTKSSTAEVVFPDTESLFSKCTVGRVFEVYDPKMQDAEDVENDTEQEEKKSLAKEEYKITYSSHLKKDKQLLLYALSSNPLTTVKKIAKKSKEMQDEMGLNVAYLAFGFLRWKESESSSVFYRAPLLLVHVDIVTGSIIDPIKIEIADDDVVVNPTFNYLLQAQYGLSLPEYSDGDTLESYYTKVRNLVRNLKWEILDECKLGIFSFLKINMYEDLKNNAELILQNGNIKALLGESDSVSSDAVQAEISGEEDHVVSNPLIDLHTVVDADSSQIEAIEMAKSGKSFVLQGPPGTGKSQTITNIIAECLHDGKRVLFVSEKQAALNVVYSKLKAAGLEDFCLELHSHKANKNAVIKEVNRVLEAPRTQVSGDVQNEIRQKESAQKDLDSYAYELHKKRDVIDQSLYQLFESYSSTREYSTYKILISNIQIKGPDYLHKAISLLDQYAEYTTSIGLDYRKNAWYGFTHPSITFEERNQLKDDLEILAKGYQNLYDNTKAIQEKYEIKSPNIQDTQRWRALLIFSSNSDTITPALLSIDSLEYVIPRIRKMMELSTSINAYKAQLTQTFTDNIIQDIDGRDLCSKLAGQYQSGLTRLFSGEYKSLIASLKPYYKNEDKLKYQKALDNATLLSQLQFQLKEYAELESETQGYLGPCYQGTLTNWSQVMNDLSVVRFHLDASHSDLGALPQMDSVQYQECRTEFQSEAEKLGTELNIVEGAMNRVARLFDPKVIDLTNSSYDLCLTKINECLKSFYALGNWTSFMNLLAELEKAELSPYIELAIDHEIQPEEISGSFKRAFYQQWIEYTLFTVPELSAFTRIKQDQIVSSFATKDLLQYSISKAQIKSELSQNRPDLELIAGGSSVAVLRREGRKKRKQMPIRKLLSEVGDIIQILKPCFLMSPLSVSTYLDPETIYFDTVVFDEASQIFPQDAIGAIYRGKQLIVVGDTKQMPPSNFFNSSLDSEDDEEEVGDITDFESILDICSSVFNTKSLAWHYRSRYESLIAFSNRHFYRNTLITFPSASVDREGIGVDYYHVDGVFDRKSRTNRVEAEFIVDQIFKHIVEYPERSLGVVAFSVSQQNLIDSLLQKRREQNQSYEWFFKGDAKEPFFVKNLETVQGDERDTIIFSVAYAKDAEGRFLHNFGPINRAGGERRLNVAFTRAKDNIQLVSSIRYLDIDLSRTGSEGVRLLRAYLDYAENGESALVRDITINNTDQFDSSFEMEVCDFLRENGYSVDTQVGCSGYKIDLGVKRLDSSDYVLAVECDGATYHNSKNARDRDRLRQQVLENMGWSFYRIWSTDWYKNETFEKERLLEAVDNALKNHSGSPTEQVIKQGNEEADQDPQFLTKIESPKNQFGEYVLVDALDVIYNHRGRMKEALKEILETEAPLSEAFLLKRIAPYYGREKVTNVVIDDFNYDIRNFESEGIVKDRGFFYLKGANSFTLRVPGYKREIKYIAPEELAAGLHTIIKQNVSVTKEGLYKTLTNVLGFSRTGDSIVSQFDRALNLLLKNSYISMSENGEISATK